MITVILVVALVAALACPVHMAWHMRRGRRTQAGDGQDRQLVGEARFLPSRAAQAGGCCGHFQPSLKELRSRRAAVTGELDRHKAAEPREVRS